MAKQTNKKSYIMPDGVNLAISTDNEVSYYDAGILAAGAQVTHNFEVEQLESGNAGILKTKITNQTLQISPTALWTLDPEGIAKISGGLISCTSVAGTIVNNATQTVDSGDWEYNKFIKIANQNFDLGVITVDSVTGSVNGALVANTDFYIGQNESGEYGVFILDSATVTTLVQDMVIQYDYTPSTGKIATSGDGTVSLTKYIARLRHYTDETLTTYDTELKVYGVGVDSGMSLNFKAASEQGVHEFNFSLTGNIDTSKTAGAQLFKLFIANSAYSEV